MRRASRKDSNHNEISDAFKALGCTFIDLSDTPCGFDGAVGYGGLSILVEIKDPKKPPSKRRLTPNEEKKHAYWTGGKRLIMTLEDVAETANTLRRWRDAIYRAPV